MGKTTQVLLWAIISGIIMTITLIILFNLEQFKEYQKIFDISRWVTGLITGFMIPIFAILFIKEEQKNTSKNQKIEQVLEKMLVEAGTYRQALEILDFYFTTKNLIFTRFLYEVPVYHEITLYIKDEVFHIKLNKCLLFQWWTIKKDAKQNPA